MSRLPRADWQSPACGACGAETECFDPEWFACEDCELVFDGTDGRLTAEFADRDAETCSEPCSNTWHGDHKIKRGVGYECHPCALPKGHGSDHWTGCVSIKLGDPA